MWVCVLHTHTYIHIHKKYTHTHTYTQIHTHRASTSATAALSKKLWGVDDKSNMGKGDAGLAQVRVYHFSKKKLRWGKVTLVWLRFVYIIFQKKN